MLRYLFDGTRTAVQTEAFAWQNHCLDTGLTTENYIGLIRERGRFFSDASEWMKFSKQSDLTIGMRIHGAIAAIQAGELGVCVAFDARTLELVATMGYPYVVPSDLDSIRRLSEIGGVIRLSAPKFEEKRNTLKANLLQILNQHGIVVSDRRL